MDARISKLQIKFKLTSDQAQNLTLVGLDTPVKVRGAKHADLVKVLGKKKADKIKRQK